MKNEMLKTDKIVKRIADGIEAERLKYKNKGWLPVFEVRNICKRNYTLVRQWSKEDIFELCRKLLDLKGWEYRCVAFEIVYRFKQYDREDFWLFCEWLNKYVDGWGSCDNLCTHAFGLFLYKYPEYISEVIKWTTSGNQWIKRASAVILIYSIRREKLFTDGLKIADRLLLDKEDLVRKGYGWMLKEISKHDPNMIFDYVMKRKKKMPRVALRYAIEKMDSKLRKEAMKK